MNAYPYSSLSRFAGTTGYNVGDFIPQTHRGWDDYNARLGRYEILEGYYHNLAYHQVMMYAQQLKVTEQLGKHVRGVRNPKMRLVEAYVSKVMGGVLDTQRGKSDAIPLDIPEENEGIRDSILRIWRDSQWGQKKSLYVRYGAMKGDSFLKVVDDIDRQQIRIEPCDPAKVKRIETDADGTITYIEFEYYIRDMDSNGHGFNRLYREIITPEMFKIETRQNMYMNGVHIGTMIEPYAAYRNGRNELVSEWANDYGFVPVVHVQHRDMGLTFGASASHGILHKINELNDLASILNDGMRLQVHLPLVFKNAKVTNADFGSDSSTNPTNQVDNPKKDTMRVLNITGQDTDVIQLSPTIDIANGLQNIESIEVEIERDTPELTLHRLREGGQLTAPGVRSAYDDAISKFAEARGNYDTGLVTAQKMALIMMDIRRYDGAPRVYARDLYDERINHSIGKRPIISDTLSLSEKLTITLQGMSQSAPQVFYEQAGWSETEADDFMQTADAQRNQFMLSSPFQQRAELQPADDTEATPQDAFDTRQNGSVNATDLMEADRMLMSA